MRKLDDAEPPPLKPAARAFEGLRVLSATHAIAGPTVGRTLAEQGAQVLQIGPPHHFEHEWVYNDANVGHRSALVDLSTQADKARALIREAHVFVDSFRGRKLFAPEELAALRPGIIVVTIRCYGWDGPWSARGGFDMLGSAASGLAWAEGDGDKPALPPTALVNDYVTGYLGAAGVAAALLQQAEQGGSYHVSVSLTRTAMWILSLGLVDPSERSFSENFLRRIEQLKPGNLTRVKESLCQRLHEPAVLEADTPLGRLRRLAPAVNFSATPGSWSDPLLVPRGSSPAEWPT